MNPQDAHGWFDIALQFMPLVAWQVLALTAVIATALTYLAEFLVPGEWTGAKPILCLYGGSAVLGVALGLFVWPALAAVPVGVCGALIGLAGRQIAAKKWPILSPRAQAIIVRRNAAGDVVGVKVGDDPTIITTRPPDDHQ